MKRFKRLLSALLAVIMCLSMMPITSFAATTHDGFDNFEKRQSFKSNTFTDVSETDWFYGNVKSVYELGLMVGKGENKFDTESGVTIAETITIASRIHSIYYSGSDDFETSDPWYKAYTDYALDNNIFQYDVNDYSKTATRAEFASILVNALPAAALEDINKVADNAIPDVKNTDAYSFAVYKFYRAGIMIGNDEVGSFAPDSEIKRSEVAAISARMVDKSLRKSVQLGKEYTISFDMDGKGQQVPSQTVVEGYTVEKPTDPTKSSYIFKGWYTQKTGGSAYDFSAPVYSDITLYARWQIRVTSSGSSSSNNQTYTVSFDSNGGSSVTSQSVKKGKTAVMPANPQKDEMVFAGWYLDQEFNTLYDFSSPVSKKITLYAKWVASVEDLIQISIEDYDESIITEESSITISGTVTSVLPIASVQALSTNYYEEAKPCAIEGTNNWSSTVELAIGTNIVSITATDEYGNALSYDVVVNRNNTEVVYSDNVKLADEEDYQQLYDDVVAVWNDDNDTPSDESDDRIILLVEETSLLLSQIEDSLLLPGEIYIIPENDMFLTGFSGIYELHRAPEGNEDYPSSEYTDELYEEIVFVYPNLYDLFDTDISLDLSSGVDPDNPISFAILPDGTEIELEYPEEASLSADEMSLFSLRSGSMIGNPLYSKAGWITDELKTKMLPKLSTSVDQYNRVNISLKWSDVVLYDHDGVKNDGAVDYGQVKLSGEFYVKNLKHEGGIEWHPSLWPWDIQILPQQLKSKLSYKYGGQIQLKTDASVSTGELVKLCNGGFENKAEFWGLSISGVDTFKDKIVVGVIGFNLVPPRAVVANSIKSQAAASTLTPSVVLYIFLGLDGQITAEATLTAGYSSSVEKGFNIQKNGYTGSYGTQAQNRSEYHYNVGSDYTLDVYNKDEGSFVFNIAGEVEASLDVGIGVGAGLLIGGLCPATVDGSFFGRVSGKAEGQINFLPTFGVEGEASLYAGVGVQANIDAAIAAKCKIGTAGFDFNKHFEHILWETSLSTASLTGTIYQSDSDGDNSNNVKIDNAKITLKKNDTGKVWTVYSIYDENNSQQEYTYKIPSLPNGKYTITVEKDGYDTYVNNNLLFEGSTTHDVFLNKLAEIDGICTLSGKITVADEDTDTTNNVGLSGAKITIKSNVTGYSFDTTTDANGTYSFANLAPGNYTISVEKTGYITIIEAVAIADNTENYYNTMLEAISEDYLGNGNASGVIYDAINGRSVPGLTLLVRSGVGVTSSDIVRTLTTDDNGKYLLNDIAAGNYTVEVVDNRSLDNEAQRYKTSMFNVKILGGCSIPNQNGYVTNELNIDQLRIVLRWGENPRDLDSHLVGPTSSGGRFHIYYSNKVSSTNNLDHDDTSSYGPETTTIYETAPGIYTYLVHDYTNKNSYNSTALANSGAYIEVYYGDSSIALATYNVPSGEGTVWAVFQFNSNTGTITPINQMSYQTYPSSVGSNYPTSEDASVFTLAAVDDGDIYVDELKDYELVD